MSLEVAEKKLLKRKNHLIGVYKVIEIYNRYHPDKTGLSNRAILRLHINPQLTRPITERTLYNYINEPVQRDIKRIEAIEQQQLNLFN
ncbi:MAG: hypothetical protein N4A74_21530 [Carboxylicivirga sp.]|jgi:hypothetical protein|nr:hypothetical protein [Carboxylicivirga sp.]